jgi:hypothetical protein
VTTIKINDSEMQQNRTTCESAFAQMNDVKNPLRIQRKTKVAFLRTTRGEHTECVSYVTIRQARLTWTSYWDDDWSCVQFTMWASNSVKWIEFVLIDYLRAEGIVWSSRSEITGEMRLTSFRWNSSSDGRSSR